MAITDANTTTFQMFDRAKPLFERLKVPCQVVYHHQGSRSASQLSIGGGGGGGGNSTLLTSPLLSGPSQTKCFTIRILSGRRPVGGSTANSFQSNHHGGGTERCIRLEITDECADFRRPLAASTKTAPSSSFLPPPSSSNPPTAHHFQRPPVMMQQRPQEHNSFTAASGGGWQRDEVDLNCSMASSSCSSGPIHTYELEVGETDFASLQRDQALLVDFGSFADSFIALLGYCDLGETTDEIIEGRYRRQAAHENLTNSSGSAKLASSASPAATPPRTPYSAELPRYTCRLEDFSGTANNEMSSSSSSSSGAAASQARFSIVESNQFRELTHFSLNLNKGTDATIRSYLSSRLHQTMTENAALRCNLQSQIARTEDAERLTRETTERMEHLRTTSETEMRELQTKSEEALQRKVSQVSADGQRSVQKKDDEILQLQGRLEQEISTLSNKVEVLETQRSRLEEDRSRLQSDNANLSKELLQEKENVRSLTRELDSANHRADQMNDRKVSLDKSLHEAQVRIAGLEQSKVSQEQALDHADALRKAAEAGVSATNDTLKSHLVQLQEARGRIIELESELCKRKDGFSRCERDCAELKVQVKDSFDRHQQTEKLLAEKNDLVTSLQQRIEEAQSKAQKATSEKQVVERELSEAKDKLAQSAKLLESNQNVITWLNKEINESQFGSGSCSAARTSAPLPLCSFPSPSRRSHLLGPAGGAGISSSSIGGVAGASPSLPIHGGLPNSSESFPRSHFSSSIAGITNPHRLQPPM